MQVNFGKGETEFGPGVQIDLTGDEVAIAIEAYLLAHSVRISGPRTIRVNGKLCSTGKIYVDPSGFVIHHGKRIDGRGERYVAP
jgi:hypothetical protein